MYYQIRYIVFFCIVCVQAGIMAQNGLFDIRDSDDLVFSNIGVEQGLSHSDVYCITQDSKGFMWFGTGDGLNRYDGYTFTIFKHDPQDSLSLSQNFVLELLEDKTGALWVGTRGGGLNRFNHKTQQFTRFMADSTRADAISDNIIWAIFIDSQQQLWIGTEHGGLNRFNAATETFEVFRHDPNNPNTISDKGVGAFYEDGNGILWIGTQHGGLNRFDREKKTFKWYRHDPANPNSLGGDNIMTIAEDDSRMLWIGVHKGGLNRFDRETETFTRFTHQENDPNSLGGHSVRAILKDDSGKLLLGHHGEGVSLMNPDKKTFKRLKYDPFDVQSFSGKFVLSIFKDTKGCLWFGTELGVIKTQTLKSFTHYQKRVLNGDFQKGDNFIWAIYEDPTEAGRKLWISTRDSGLYHLNRTNGTVVRYQQNPQIASSLSSNQITFITKDKSGNFWIGTNNGLNRFNPDKGIFERFSTESPPPHQLKNNYISTILEDTTSEGNVLWIGTRSGGLHQLNLANNHIRQFHYHPNRINTNEDYIFQLTKGDFNGEKVIWLATYGGGLIRFHPKSASFYAYRFDEKNEQSISSNYLYSIYYAKSGDYWAGTASGLNKFDPVTGVFERFHLKDGLTNETIYGILEDDEGFLWLATNAGIEKFDPQNRVFRNYNVQDGLQGNLFADNTGAYFKSSSGELFFGGNNGLSSFFPDQITDNQNIPPIVFTDFKIFNKSVPIRNAIKSAASNQSYFLESVISECDEITLSYRESVFTFEFAALDYTVPEKNQYAYMLEGFDENWTYVGNQNTATYTNIDPGEYVFRVKGSNNDNVWNENGAAIRLIITPPWWRSTWAYVMYVVTGILLLIIARRFEINRQQLKHKLEIEHLQAEKLVEIDRMKSRFFANISHEFRTPLTLIKGPVEKLWEKVTDDEGRHNLNLIRNNCQRLMELINQLLDLSKLESRRMRLKVRKEELVSMVRGMTMAFESLAELHNIELIVNAPNEKVYVYVERRKFEMIISNLLSNAFKFTPEGGKIAVELKQDTINDEGKAIGHRQLPTGNNEFIEIAITDTGIGIQPEHQAYIFERFYQVDDSTTRRYSGTGIGLALVNELVELHGGKIIVSSDVNKGSQFVIFLPTGKEHLNPEDIISDEEISTSGNEQTENEPAIFTDEYKTKDRFDDNRQPIVIDGRSPKEKTILVIEDNPDVRKYICDTLKETYHTISAKNGKIGLAIAVKAFPDLVVCDVMMPEMDGFSFCEKLKTDEKTSHIPVILLTAKASEENRLAGLEIGADDYLTKPFSAPELLARIKNLIAQRRRLQELFQSQIILAPGDVTVTSMDQQFLQKAIDIIETYISDTDFTAEIFSSEMSVSRVHLNRKIKVITGLTTTHFIRSIRLKRAAQLLPQKSGNISEIAYSVGFNNPSFFATCFREQFGVSPSEFVHRQTDKKE